MLLPTLLRFRLDFVAFALVVLVACVWCYLVVRHRRPNEPTPKAIGLVLLALVIAGGLAAEFFGEQRKARMISVLAAFGPTYAYELQRLGHARVTFHTPPDDPTYLALIDAERNWLRVNPLISDVYTFRYDGEGKVRFVVDSETDYDHNGRIEGEREERTPIGELYPEATEDFHAALRGEARFDATLVPDRWGLWVSSLTPVYDDAGRVEAAVGLDYPAMEWLTGILQTRAVALFAAAVLAAIVLATATVGVLMRAEIRERRTAQEQLRRDKDAVDLVSRAKTEFISVMTHEIRSPLTALMGYASLLLESPLNPVQQRYARTIAKAGERLSGMLSDILDLSKLDAGKLVIESAPYSPAALLDEITDTMTARAMERGLALHLDAAIAEDLILLGDATRLRQVITNLLGNAIKFTDRGTVILKAHWARTGAGSGTLGIAVADTGPGIPAERITRLFDMYPAGRPAGLADGAGGTGLAICRQLVELMGGRITVHSVPGKGSEFSFTLLCDVVPAAAAIVAAEGTEPARRAHDPAQILLINPHPLSRDILRTVLTRYGYHVLLAADVEEAAPHLADGDCAVVLIDVEDAGLNSLFVAQLLRARMGSRKRLPLFALTRRAKPPEGSGTAADIDEYLTKPVYMPAVLSVLQAYVQPARKSGSASGA